MKALSIRQPWAWLIVNGYKDIENRDWDTKYRGFLLIHAGKQADKAFFVNKGKTLFLPYVERVCCASVAARMPERLEEYERGGIIGYVTVQRVVTQSSSPWFSGKYGFVLTQAATLPFIPLRGQLSLFNVPMKIEEQINTFMQRQKKT
jgi:hypothetical protein